jgi:hypothetical protein
MTDEKVIVDINDVEDLIHAAEILITVAQKAGLEPRTVETVKTGIEVTKGSVAIGKTVVGAGAAVSAATGLTVAATSGAGITSGLAAAGGLVGGGMATGPVVLAAAPAYLASTGLNNTVFKDDLDLCEQEREARSAARKGTTVGAVTGMIGVGTVTVAGGASGAAIMGTLASVGSVVGGGAIAGTVVLAVAPMVAAAVVGFGIYKWFGGRR